MTEFDASVACLLRHYVLPAGIFLAVLCYIWRHYKQFRYKVFARLFEPMSSSYHQALESDKAELFAELADLRSLDWEARNLGHIRLLEIGVGPGANLSFYPRNARLIAVDPNPHFREYVERNCARFPNVKLERVVVGEGEDLHQVESGSVDVVVTTAVLCSVNDVDKVLDEILRVLAPGGKYFFVEHVQGGHGTWCHTLQHAVRPVFQFLFECDPTRDIGSRIQAAGFSKIQMKPFEARLGPLLRPLVGPHIRGTAEK